MIVIKIDQEASIPEFKDEVTVVLKGKELAIISGVLNKNNKAQAIDVLEFLDAPSDSDYVTEDDVYKLWDSCSEVWYNLVKTRRGDGDVKF